MSIDFSADYRTPNGCRYHYADARQEAADRLGISTVVLTDILERKYGAGHNLAYRMAEFMGASAEVFLDWKKSTHPIWLRPPLRTKTAPAKAARPESYFLPHGSMAALARKARINQSTLWYIINRRATPRVAKALRLEEASGVPASVWRSNKTSTHQIFEGEPITPKAGKA